MQFCGFMVMSGGVRVYGEKGEGEVREIVSVKAINGARACVRARIVNK